MARILLMNFVLIAALAVLPLLVTGGSTLTIATQTLVWVVMAQSYRIIFGQTGLLSFCHAIFFGAGGFAAAHIIAAAERGGLIFLPPWITPLPAFVAGALVGLVFGSFLARRTGVSFVMITIALSALVISASGNFDSIFGGEAGIGIDRAYDDFLFGLASFGPQREAYWLVLFWCVLATGLMWLLSHSAFGHLATATRENEERVRFSGFSTYRIRLMAMVLSGGFAGLAGALHTINIEQVTTDLFSLKTSAFALFMCVIGGTSRFYGPILGAVLLSVLDKILPDYTQNWLLYLGVIFCVILIFSPQGLVGIFEGLRARFRSQGVGLVVPLGTGIGFGALTVFGLVFAVEMARALSGTNTMERQDVVTVAGLSLDPSAVLSWIMILILLAAGIAGLRWQKGRAKNEGVTA